MKYYTFWSLDNTNNNDHKNIRDYIFKTNMHKTLAMLKLTDENYPDFFEKAGIPEESRIKGWGAIGEDNGLYILSTTGIKKTADKTEQGKRLIWHINKVRYRTSRRTKVFNEKILAKADSPIIRHGKTITSFKKYIYVNKNEEVVIPYRLKIVKAPNRPLVICHGGGGTTGCDNFKTLFEFFSGKRGKKVIAANCNILIPQYTTIKGETEDECFEIYADNCAELIKKIINTYDIDENRIYIYGTSLGAKITWKSLWRSPELYTASVQAMGLVNNYADADFSIIKDIPIWIAHSSDDALPIESDDYCYEQLKALGADIKYTRWDKYGHKMSSKFYKQEPWLEWLLSKSKQNSRNQSAGQIPIE